MEKLGLEWSGPMTQTTNLSGTTRKTIWTWARDPDNPFPKPHKIGDKTTRWNNNEIKQMGCSL